MSSFDARIDTYIAKSQPFAQPILAHLRELVHKACPEVTETIKWGMPHFEYKGPFCGIAAFKQHAVFGFWKHVLLPDPNGYLAERGTDGMGSLGKMFSIKDLPPDKVIVSFIKEAMRLNDEGIKLPAKKKTVAKEVVVPAYFSKALKKNKAANQVFEKASPSFRKEYIMWLEEAKTDATRDKRMETALEWIAEGKGRNWKYETKK